MNAGGHPHKLYVLDANKLIPETECWDHTWNGKAAADDAEALILVDGTRLGEPSTVRPGHEVLREAAVPQTVLSSLAHHLHATVASSISHHLPARLHGEHHREQTRWMERPAGACVPEQWQTQWYVTAHPDEEVRAWALIIRKSQCRCSCCMQQQKT